MTREHVVDLLRIRYQFGHFFVSLLTRLISRMSDAGLEGELKKVLEENLKEETGQIAEYGPEHMLGRKRLLVACGVDYDTWVPGGDISHPTNVHPASLKVIVGFRNLVSAPTRVAVGVAAIAESESLVPQHYRYILQNLAISIPELTQDDLSHLTGHVMHDFYHGKNLEELLEQWPNQSDIRYGSRMAVSLWDAYWTDLIGHPLSNPEL